MLRQKLSPLGTMTVRWTSGRLGVTLASFQPFCGCPAVSVCGGFIGARKQGAPGEYGPGNCMRQERILGMPIFVRGRCCAALKGGYGVVAFFAECCILC